MDYEDNDCGGSGMMKTLDFDSCELPYTAGGLRWLYGLVAFQMGQV